MFKVDKTVVKPTARRLDHDQQMQELLECNDNPLCSGCVESKYHYAEGLATALAAETVEEFEEYVSLMVLEYLCVDRAKFQGEMLDDTKALHNHFTVKLGGSYAKS
jgi:hypothetical protein